MLAKKKRLTKNKEFDNVFNTGKSAFNVLLGIKATKNELEYNRIGIIISTKVSKKAYLRNKIKRQIKAIFTEFEAKLKQGNDIVVICLPPISKKEFLEIKESLVSNLKKIKLL